MVVVGEFLRLDLPRSVDLKGVEAFLCQATLEVQKEIVLGADDLGGGVIDEPILFEGGDQEGADIAFEMGLQFARRTWVAEGEYASRRGGGLFE